MKTLYEILGVDASANREDIQQAYRKAAQRTHPDREGGSEADFKEVKHAFEVLHDAERRKQYDETGASGDGQKETPEADAMKIIQSMLEHYIEKALGQDPLKFMRKELARVKAEQQEVLKSLAKKLEKTKKLMSHLVAKNKADTVELLMQVTLNKMSQEVLGRSHVVATCDAAVLILDPYDYTGPVDAERPRSMGQESLMDFIRESMRHSQSGPEGTESGIFGSSADAAMLDEFYKHSSGEKSNKAKGTKFSSPHDPRNYR